ncbi:Zinc finger RING/FYVE/PHD-type protein [Venturia nashicola]|uniref:Zinc finger RING/FYVE/PHD-type protein n=1 Tax=Venturia nashicola TaxID=86259 RepID=A0A4Z1PB09_9PEZI|nr:Zinc finger RING/FYVE/PHD-type protein [Venturia nashicola]
MSSSVFYKFKSSKEPQRITFDGTSITVFELKRDIIKLSGLGDGTDFDLSIYDEASNEEYTDDTTTIPRSSSVVARRLPAARHGHGKAARYVSGKAPVNAKNSYRTEASKSAIQPKPITQSNSTVDLGRPQTEEERIAAMFAAEGSQWEQQQQEMANAKPVWNNNKGHNKRPINVPDHEPPAKYICHRCGLAGHWIQLCPTNDDPNFEQKPKIKRTTGIPRSFMKKVEKPVGATDDGLTEESNQGGTIMLDADGNHVIVAPDTASWEKEQAKLKASAAQQEASKTGSKELQQLGLECPIDKRLFVAPMKTPCCGKTYCSDCIENALADNDLKCPNCGTEDVILENLTADEEMVAKIKKYEDDKAAAKLAEEEAKSPKPQSPGATDNTTVPDQDAKSKSKSPTPENASADVKSPSSATESNPKKRPASEELENKRSPPKAPKAMLREQTQAQGPVPPGFDQNFIEQMNKFAPMNGTQPAAPFFPSNMGAMGMNPMNGMMGMPAMGMVNPMMGMSPMMGMPNNMMNPMMMGRGMTTGMGAFPQNGMQQQPNFNNGMMNGGFGGQGWQGGQQGWGGPQQQQQMANGMAGRFGNFPNQQRQMFAGQGATDAENAYTRKPVNPHRAQNRQRRQARHDDYNTL